MLIFVLRLYVKTTMATEVIIALIGIASTVISSIVTFRQTKKRYNAEVDNQVISNLKESLSFYMKICDDNSKRLDDFCLEDSQLRKQVSELKMQLIRIMSVVCYNTTCKLRIMEDNTKTKNIKENGD